jgi:pyruvate dehydrogenase E2 component (dihydrolipoamide acetyltransferase)
MAEFVMPTLGADMTEGTLVAWKKKVGDRVEKGDIIAEVETDKATIEVEVFTSGTIERLVAQPGDKVPVGTVMATIREEKAAPASPPPSPVTPVVRREGTPLAAAEQIQVARPPSFPARAPTIAPARAQETRLRISPAARQLADQLGIDPATVTGTGPDGAITRDDIQRAAGRAEAAPPELVRPPTGVTPQADRMGRMRQTIAAAMARSKREIPHYYLSTMIDLHMTLSWLTAENAARSVADRLLPSALLIKAVALALKEVPELNSVWKDGQIITGPFIHIGVAIALRGGGLVAPALHNTDRLSLTDVMGKLQDLVKRARAGSLRSSELSDPTITVTNLGDLGVDSVLGVIYPPQVALVGFGKVAERPWVVEGHVIARPLITASLSADHRVSDGHRGGRFLAAVDRLLQNPDGL